MSMDTKYSKVKVGTYIKYLCNIDTYVYATLYTKIFKLKSINFFNK